MSKELYAALKSDGSLEYGSVFPGEKVRNILGVTLPEFGRKSDFDAVVLCELSAIDYVRNILLGEGKYLTACYGGYRVLLPSENAKQVQAYMKQADNKLRRALKLSRNMPKCPANSVDNTHVRLVMKREAIRLHGATA